MYSFLSRDITHKTIGSTAASQQKPAVLLNNNQKKKTKQGKQMKFQFAKFMQVQLLKFLYQAFVNTKKGHFSINAKLH